MKFTPTKVDLLGSKFIAIETLIFHAIERINRGYYVKGKQFLNRAMEDCKKGRELLKDDKS